MKSHVIRPAAAVVTLVFALALVACGGGGGGNTVNTDITGVTVSPSTLSLTVGGVAGTLTAAVQPDAAPNKTVNWSSSNENVARVEKTDATHAIVTAVSGGSATITVTTEVAGKTSTCPVTVTVPVSGLSLPKTLSVFLGESKSLAATLTPSNATNQAVTWGNDTPAAVAVQGTGLTVTVRGVAIGTSKITATSQGNPSATDYCDVTVTPVPVTGVALSPTLIKLAPSGTGTLSAVISPANATDKTLEWTNSNTDAVTVTASGTTATVRAVATGTATITVRSTNGFTATSTIVVAAAQAPGAFVAGSFGLLKNGTFTIDNGTRLNAVYVDAQNNVHATGRDSANQAVYVWNGVSIVLPRDQWATAAEGNSICIDDGHVYIAGRQSSDSRTQAKLWVDGANRPLTNVGNYNYSDATSVFAGTVSVLGSSQFVLMAGGVVGTSSDAVKGAAWYGDTLITDIQAANGYVRSVTIANSNLYVGGDFGLLYISLINLALGNYTPSVQNDASGIPFGPVNAIFTVGNNIHAVGYSGHDAVYYNSSREKTVLFRNTLRAYARASGICVSEYGTVYVAGYDWNTENDVVAVLWTNSTRQELDAPKKYNAAMASSVFARGVPAP